MSAPKIPHVAPANDPPALRTFRSLVDEFGFKNVRALRDWCRRRGVAYTRDGKYLWADRNHVVAAIARGASYVPPAAAPPPPSVASWVDATIGGGRG
ncbi:MAG: hypothetical protein U0324_29375 [Polyangiales bacterium]